MAKTLEQSFERLEEIIAQMENQTQHLMHHLNISGGDEACRKL